MTHIPEAFKTAPASKIFLAAASASTKTTTHRFLQRMEAGTASVEEWRLWGVQRYQAASGFNDFLKAGIQKAARADMIETESALLDNLFDEKGVSRKTGKPIKSGSHESWRLRFYDGLSLSQKTLKSRTMLPETFAYRTTLADMTTHASVYEHVGALIALEYAIGQEMTMLDEGLDNTPALQTIFNRESKEGRVKRLYITHHAAHDMEQHFPELVHAVVKDIESRPCLEDAVREIRQGAINIGYERQKFYNAVQAAALALS